jgi:hypothetical protein
MRNKSVSSTAPFANGHGWHRTHIFNPSKTNRCNARPAAQAVRPAQALFEASVLQDLTAVQPPLLEVDVSLRSWIHSHGGAVWSSLRVTDNAPCGCRGVITTAALTVEHARTSPLILVPEKLYMTTDDARELLQKLDLKRTGLSFWRHELPGAVQLAVLLALERQRGEASFWAPYIRSLPPVVPCAWALPQEQLRAALEALGPGAEDWGPAVDAAQAVMCKRAEHAVKQYGKHLPGELSVEDVAWALGQVRYRGVWQTGPRACHA